MNNTYKRTTYKGKPIDEHRKVMEIYVKVLKIYTNIYLFIYTYISKSFEVKVF